MFFDSHVGGFFRNFDPHVEGIITRTAVQRRHQQTVRIVVVYQQAVYDVTAAYFMIVYRSACSAADL